MRKIIDECYEKAKKILSENSDLVKLIAENLLEYETLTKEQIEYLVKTGRMPDEEEDKEQDELIDIQEEVEEVKEEIKDIQEEVNEVKEDKEEKKKSSKKSKKEEDEEKDED